MMSGEPTSTAAPQMASPAQSLPGTFPTATAMYYINDPQAQRTQSLMSVDPRGVMPPPTCDPQQYDFHQQHKLAPQVFGGPPRPFGAGEDETAADQQMVLENLEGRTMAPIVDEVDARSVFVGNVDYGTTPPELQEHFKNCGPINRITIMIDRYTGHPKGYAYIEFQDESAMPHAVSLNQSIFRNRPLKVIPKRKNMPGFSRGRGVLGRGAALSTAFPAFMRGKLRGRGRALIGYLPRYRGRAQRGGFYPY